MSNRNTQLRHSKEVMEALVWKERLKTLESKEAFPTLLILVLGATCRASTTLGSPTPDFLALSIQT